MANDREQTACCGLYCGDCIPSNRPLFETAQRLREELEKCQFGEYAKFKSKGNQAFAVFKTFEEVLDAIVTLQCAKTCCQGDGRSDCTIRGCAHGQGMEGCWQCAGFETCGLLEPLSAGHGDTVKHNLRTIRQLGAENWACQRGPHYTWTQVHDPSPAPPASNELCHKVAFESLPWQAPAPGVRFKAFEHEGRRLRLAEFTKDFVEADWCVKGHIGYVLEGVLAVDFHDRTDVFAAGDGLFIPPGDEHGHKARTVTDSVTLVLVEENRI
jgi:hypothetical protein